MSQEVNCVDCADLPRKSGVCVSVFVRTCTASSGFYALCVSCVLPTCVCAITTTTNTTPVANTLHYITSVQAAEAEVP